MGWLKNPFKRGQAGQSVARRIHTLPAAQSVWGQRVEVWFFHGISLGFSGVSAFAIWQIFISHHLNDLGRMIEGGVIATCFAIAGYFLSRNIAYRWMAGELVYSYIPVCLVVELVEIYCNYVVGVSYLDLSDFFQTIPAEQHGLLLTIGRIVVSSIPAMTLFLAVAQMDLERRKVQQPVLQHPSANTYATGYTPTQNTIPSQRPQQGRTVNNATTQPQYQAQKQGATNGANPPPGVQWGP